MTDLINNHSSVHSDTAAEKFITGKVTYPGAAKIDGNVQVEVELRDVSLMDAPSKLIASTKISNPKTFPISYKLSYNPSDIKPGLTYAVSARITGAGTKLLYLNDVRKTVTFTQTASTTIDIPVIQGNSVEILSYLYFVCFSWRFFWWQSSERCSFKRMFTSEMSKTKNMSIWIPEERRL